MELIYITHGNLLNLHHLSAAVSWAIVLGGLYGVLRLAVDVIRLFARAPANLRNLRHPR